MTESKRGDCCHISSSVRERRLFANRCGLGWIAIAMWRSRSRRLARHSAGKRSLAKISRALLSFSDLTSSFPHCTSSVVYDTVSTHDRVISHRTTTQTRLSTQPFAFPAYATFRSSTRNHDTWQPERKGSREEPQGISCIGRFRPSPNKLWSIVRKRPLADASALSLLPLAIL